MEADKTEKTILKAFEYFHDLINNTEPINIKWYVNQNSGYLHEHFIKIPESVEMVSLKRMIGFS